MTSEIFSSPGVVDAVDAYGRPMPVALPDQQLPRAWCHRLKGPCAARCFGGECRMIDFPDTEPAPEIPQPRNMDGSPFGSSLEQRMPPGTQIVIALLSGLIFGLVMGALWPLVAP